MNKASYSPVIYHYLKKYQEDPSSRVFAPLAEAYRKAGLIDEAIDIAREGLRVHPGFIGGRVALARALFDKKAYSEVIGELKPVVRDVPDNLAAQKLLAESHLMEGQLVDALSCYKMYLYFNPSDEEMGQLVRELEQQAYQKGNLVLKQQPQSVSPKKQRKVSKRKWADRLSHLQEMLLKVERYRANRLTRG